MRVGLTAFGRRSWRVVVMCLSACFGLVADNPDTGHGMLHYASVTHCPLHGDTLREGLIPWVEGGMPAGGLSRESSTVTDSWQPEYEWEAETREFPFAHSKWSSGCCWDPRMADCRVRVRYCQTCRDVQSKWRVEHPDYAWRPHDPREDGPVIGEDDEGK
jgi:hypothetical protein